MLPKARKKKTSRPLDTLSCVPTYRTRPHFGATFALALFCLLLGTLFGAWIAAPQPSEADTGQSSPYARLDTFARVMGYIERSYVDPVDQKTLIDEATKGMVSSLDPHSLFLPPEEYKALRNETSGQLVGVGLEITRKPDGIYVVAPIEGAPAARAGIRPGDRVVRVNQTSVHDASLRDVVKLLKGPKASDVVVEVLRANVDGVFDPKTPLRFKLTREHIDVVAVRHQVLERGVVYVRIRSFQQGIADDVLDAWENASAELGQEPKGLVLDLRDNPGGLLLEAVQLVDLFVNQGVIVSTEARTRDASSIYRAHPSQTRIQAPVAVLVNQGSASASEIVSGALRDHKRAKVFGQKTFGKGSVQSIIDMKDGSGLKLTTALYYTPSRARIHGKGISPDVVLAPSQPTSPEQDPAVRAASQHILSTP